MKKSLEEKLRNAVENNRFNYEKHFGDGCKWHDYHLIVNELVWARNIWDGYEIDVYTNEYRKQHIATLMVDYIPNPKGGYCFVPRLQTDYFNAAI